MVKEKGKVIPFFLLEMLPPTNDKLIEFVCTQLVFTKRHVTYPSGHS